MTNRYDGTTVILMRTLPWLTPDVANWHAVENGGKW